MIRNGMRSGTKKKGSGSKDDHAAMKSGIVILFLVAVMVGYYFYLSNRQQAREPDVTLTAVQELLTTDLEKHYPPTPKEVVRYYSEITKCYYNEEYSDEELEQLAAQARFLLDDDLAANNEWEQYFADLKSDITYYKNNSMRISSYSLSSSTDVYEFSEDGYDFARLYCTYVLSTGGVRTPVEEVYLLRKDEAGHWKIYGWDRADNVSVEE